jgi:hypothetical protein
MQEFKEEYYNGVNRMNPSLENKIKNNTTDISNNPAFPSTDKDGNPINFIELLAYKRFLDVVKKVQYYTGIENVSGERVFMQLQKKLEQSIMQVYEIESKHRPYLEKLGIDLVTEEMELPKDAIKIDAKIVNMGSIEKDGFAIESKEPSKEQVQKQFEVKSKADGITPMEVFQLEKEKRRFINLLIQGASKKGHYMFEIRRSELNKIHPELANLYGIVMSINDLTYWLMPENIIEQMAKNPQAVAGKEEIEEENDKTKIKTQGICFPVSVHENIKGVMEVFGTHGLPDSKEAQEMIFNSTDTLINEVSDVRLGVVVWEKFLKTYPIEVFEEGQRYIQHYIFTKFCSLDTDEFFDVAKQILNDNPSGAKFIQKLVDDIYVDIKKRDLDNNFGDEFADGGMAGLSDVSSMLPNPLPMSTITPMARGGSVKDSLLKELHKLHRDLNSSRLNTYLEGDNSEQEMARRRERESKLARFNEVRRLLNEMDNTTFSDGGNLGEIKFQIIPHKDKFIIQKITIKKHEDSTYPSKEFIYGFNRELLEFNDMKSAQKFIDNIELKYPYGIPKANVGMILLASELLKKQQAQQQQPQVVYYVPQPQEGTQQENTGITQNIPEMANGGELVFDNNSLNDFCIENLIGLANDIQAVKYYVTDRFKVTDFESKYYKGKLIIVFKKSASVSVVNAITKFVERAEDCHHLFEQSVNVSGSQPNTMTINLLSDKYSDTEFNKGGKVYDYAPKQINIAKTKKITTNLGDYNLGLITNDFVYFVNSEEDDDNANVIMYKKNGELLSDNYFANNDLFETLENEDTFEFIHPDVEAYRQEILKGN